jgi:hypothetical protein
LISSSGKEVKKEKRQEIKPQKIWSCPTFTCKFCIVALGVWGGGLEKGLGAFGRKSEEVGGGLASRFWGADLERRFWEEV